jgi:HAD superfamily hydrolase (TIGR01509 family)
MNLIFDCDGVIVDTERDGHREAFNAAFAAVGIPDRWDEATYGELLAIAGGKERMRAWFDRNGWPPAASDRTAFIQELHRRKTDLFMEIIGAGKLPLRPGVARLVDEAISAGVRLAVCSTSNERAVELVIERMLGAERRKRFLVLAGDVVAKKKPDPGIYLLAAERLRASPGQCVVVEDSRNGLLAAKAALMRCIITRSCYTRAEDFHEADAVFDDLGDPPGRCVRLSDLARLIGGGP